MRSASAAITANALLRRSAARNASVEIRRSASAVKSASAAITANALLRRSAARNASVNISNSIILHVLIITFVKNRFQSFCKFILGTLL